MKTVNDKGKPNIITFINIENFAIKRFFFPNLIRRIIY